MRDEVALRNPSLAEKVLITDLAGSVGVSQTAPGAISTDKPSGCCEESWDFVLGALSPSACLQNVPGGQGSVLCAILSPASRVPTALCATPVSSVVPG